MFQIPTITCVAYQETYLDVVLHGLVSRAVCDEELEVLVIYLTGRGSDVLLPHVLDYYTHSALTTDPIHFYRNTYTTNVMLI